MTKRMRTLVVLAGVVLGVSLSCASVVKSSGIPLPIKILKMTAGSALPALSDGIVARLPEAARALLGTDITILKTTGSYIYENREEKVDYYLVYCGTKGSVSVGTAVKNGATVATSKEGFGFVVYCDTLDPWLCINSAEPPTFAGGGWWYDPMLFVAASTDWFSYKRAEDVEVLISEICHTHPEEMPPEATTSIYLEARYSFKYALDAYPKELKGDALRAVQAAGGLLPQARGMVQNMRFYNEFTIAGHRVLVAWQKGFDEYLADEYTLEEDLWLYGNFVYYTGWNDTTVFLVRDFSLDDKYETAEKIMRSVMIY